jgi:hypothetical protein
MIPEMNIYQDLANPKAIPLRRLVALTRDYYRMSTATAENGHARYHRWYYRLAAECERRGLELERVIKR